MSRRIALVPGVLALLPEYASLEDAVPELRAAALAAAAWLGPDVEVLADEQGARVAAYLLEATGVSTSSTSGGPAYLVVGNGSAKTNDEAPGYLDDRAAAFDAELGRRLRAGEFSADAELARELWASVDGINALRELGLSAGPAVVDYDGDPFGVQYWVMRWTCAD